MTITKAGGGGTGHERDEVGPDERASRDDKADEAALTGLAGAAGRDQYVGAQIARAERSARSQPAAAFDGEIYRSLTARFTLEVADHSHSGPGRYNAVGQTAFYAAPTLDAVKTEAHNYEAANGRSASGLNGKSVVRGTFHGEVLDLRTTPGVTPAALMQPHGFQGAMRNTLSKIAGEDAYTRPRALGDVARERNLTASRARPPRAANPPPGPPSPVWTCPAAGPRSGGNPLTLAAPRLVRVDARAGATRRAAGATAGHRPAPLNGFRHASQTLRRLPVDGR